MSTWLTRLKIKDLLDYREDPEHCEDVAKEIAKRLRVSQFAKIGGILAKKFESISSRDADPLAEINSALNSLYDWADHKRIWIE